MEYDLTGAGRPVVWGHGLSSSRAGEAMLGLIDWSVAGEGLHVLRYDARGHGESESTPQPQAYHWAELACDQLALADQLGIDSYVAAGASMGAATALHAAAIAPERIQALILAIPPTAWETRAAQAATYNLSAQLLDDGNIEALIAGIGIPADPLVGLPGLAEGMRAAYRDADPVRLARVLRGAALTDLPNRDLVAKICVPTLIMAWTGDVGHPMSTAEELAQLIPHAELRVASTFKQLRTWTGQASEFITAL